MQNNIEGEGTYTWPDGRIYTGHWENNMRNGEGMFIWPSGIIYKGNFEDDK